MDISFQIDFDAEEIHGVIDNAKTFAVFRNDDSFSYRNFDQLDDEVLHERLMEVCQLLLTLEE